ncbi:MAG: hypothetical protein KKC46_07170 [Proteobacteria bacterium]|nr:hypothetical protein [Pseudomonadota bacterium]
MGVGLFILFEPYLSDASIDSDGKLIAKVLPEIDDIAKKMGVTPLSNFGLNPDISDDYKNKLEKAANVFFSEDTQSGGIGTNFGEQFEKLIDGVEDYVDNEEFFDISDGINTISSILNYIQNLKKNDPDYSTRIDGFDFILEELEEYCKCLEIGKKQGARFRFEMW